MAATLMGASFVVVAAKPVTNDTIKAIGLQNVEVLATRATKTTPVAFSNLSKADISSQNFGLDLPFILSSTPSVITTSDAGAGVGYTSIRVRGTDASRINITANDIPMNDAESHSIYWVNTPDLASSIQDIQIQRGAGTSTNGSGAFGASINLRTDAANREAYSGISGSYGSFNTQKETFKIGTGLLKDHFTFDARLSHIASDGYRDRASSSLKSYFIQGGYFGKFTTIKFITFGGKEVTYHAWDGISRDKLESDRTYNPNGAIKDDNANKGKVIGFYDDQNDNYRQTNYQLLLTQRLAPTLNLNVALHYTDGFGFYQEYKNGRTLKEYLLEPYYLPGNNTPQKKSNLIRKKIVDSDFGGGVFSLNYKGTRLDATLGGGFNYYVNDHYGKVIWVKDYTAFLAPDHEYYRNKGKKSDGNLYIKGNYVIWNGLSAYADMQYRHIGYKINGKNDKWDWTANPEKLQDLAIDEKFDFFNPKAGLFWKIDRNNSAYASFSVAQKEPTRNNYTDGLFTVHPRAEKLYDYELGYNFSNERFMVGANVYYMDYTDQLVLNGKLNEIGEAMAENVPDSYRMGVELTAGVKITDWLRWDINGTLSKNKIKNYVGYVSDYDASSWDDMYSQTAINKGSTTIAFSPSFVANSVINFRLKGFAASLQSQYVSRQYLDNFENKDDSLDPYFVTNLNVSYTFKLPYTRSITLGATVYNLFNERYETNGYSQTAALYPGSDKNQKYTLSSDPRFYPMAGTNALGHITLSF